MIKRSYKYRIYPSKEQSEILEKTFGCVRFYWNKALELKLKVFEENKGKSKEERKPIPRILPSELKNDYPFLKEVDSLALANAQLNLEKAFDRFFKGKAKRPKFKRKKSRQSYTTNNVNNSIRVDFRKGTVRIPKVGEIKAKLHRQFSGKIKSATIEKTTTGKYYISILVEEEINKIPQTDKITAIDLGLKDFAIMVDNQGNIEKIGNPKYLNKALKRLVKEQRKLSRKKKGSKNYEKQRLKVARIHEKVRNQREDFLHKLSKRIVSENQAIILEDLNIKGLLSNGNLSRHIADTSWNRFIQYLLYKAQWYGRDVIFVDRFYPSSKLCSVCGYKKDDLTLSDRYWKCPVCSTEHDRDINAAKNLLIYGLTCLKGGRVGTTRTYACGGADSSDEAGSSML